jgi:hypothetical protein
VRPSAILTTMSEWGRATYGEPCRQCGFTWTVTEEEAGAIVASAADQLARELADTDGSLRHPSLSWPLVAYVCHVADNLRIWAERLAGLAAGDTRPVGRYDQDLLAEARRYDEISLLGALWSLERASKDWTEAVHRAHDAAITLVHPDRGRQSLLDVVRSNAHDVLHHCVDIRRTIDDAGR